MPIKICPECNAEHGPRKLKCACGHDFFAKKSTATTDRFSVQPAEIRRDDAGRIVFPVHTPAGACPVKLSDLTYEGVQRWGGAVVTAGAKIGVEYTPDAVRYWLREFVDINAPLFNELKPACQELVA